MNYPAWGTDNTWAAWGWDGDLTFKRLYIPLFALAQSVYERTVEPHLNSSNILTCKVDADVYKWTSQESSIRVQRFGDMGKLRSIMYGVDRSISAVVTDSAGGWDNSFYLNQFKAANGVFEYWAWNELLAKACDITQTTAVAKIGENAAPLPFGDFCTWARQRQVMVNLLRWRTRRCGLAYREFGGADAATWDGSVKNAVTANIGQYYGNYTQDYNSHASPRSISCYAEYTKGLDFYASMPNALDVEQIVGLADVLFRVYDVAGYGSNRDFDGFGYGVSVGNQSVLRASGNSYQFTYPAYPESEHTLDGDDKAKFGFSARAVAFADLSTCFTLFEDYENGGGI